MYKFIAIGDALVDTHVQIDNASVECNIDGKSCKLCMDFAKKIPITNSFQAMGGNGANVATGTAKLGLKTAIIASLGKDANGDLILSELKKNKIDTDYISFDTRAKSRYSIVLNYQGERTILSFHQKMNYVWPKNFPATDYIYYTGLSEGFEPLQDKLISFLIKHPSVKLVTNPGSYQMKHAPDKVMEAIAKSDILIVNLEEAEEILKTSIKKEKTVEALIHKLLMKGAKEVAITDAAKGAWAGNADEVWHMPSFPVEVVAKTGAGDAFSSGYASARCLGHDIHEALAWGIANSCAIIGNHGAQIGLLDQNGVKKMRNKYSNIKPKQLV